MLPTSEQAWEHGTQHWYIDDTPTLVHRFTMPKPAQVACRSYDADSKFCVTAQVLLAAHKAWFKSQKCRDCFAEILEIHKLIRPPSIHTQGPQVAAVPTAPAADPREGFALFLRTPFEFDLHSSILDSSQLVAVVTGQ